MKASIDQLVHLANLFGVNIGYLDMHGQPKSASIESLLAVIKALGAPLSDLGDVPEAIREKQLRQWQRPLEPVAVVHDSHILTLKIRLPESMQKTWISANLVTESGKKKKLSCRYDESLVIDSTSVEGVKYGTLLVSFPEKLSLGYHKLYLELPGSVSETLIIASPLKAYSPPAIKKIWGVFIPLYALHTGKSWGAGDFTDLETLVEYVSQQGGNMIGSLPLLPSFFDDESGPSPYMPASRLFWNEFYLNINRIPELGKCPSLQARINSADFKNELTALRKSRFVDYSRQIALKRKVLEELSEYFFAEKPGSFADFETYVNSHSSLEDYARFRAAGEKHGICWYNWPQAMRDGQLEEGDYSEKARQYHLYAQWLARDQIRGLSQKATDSNLNLYLDLPVGVHPYGYDVWREREVFVPGINGGAPPDPVFTSGQNWRFPPLHPDKIRDQGYRYIIDSLRHQLQLARMLRVDHMMNFHRLFWIPEGMENREGVYVNYRAEELYAILALESHRHQSVIIGEDLGIVPPEVRPAMERHGIFRTFVGQYQLITENKLGGIPSSSVASVNTHDMFPFASFWQEKDISERLILKLLDEKEAENELEQRRKLKRALINVLQREILPDEIPPDEEAVFRAILSLMAASQAYALQVNLEDLWQETQPQNIPGTLKQQNWSRKARYGFERFKQLPQVKDILCNIDKIRKGVNNTT